MARLAGKEIVAEILPGKSSLIGNVEVTADTERDVSKKIDSGSSEKIEFIVNKIDTKNQEEQAVIYGLETETEIGAERIVELDDIQIISESEFKDSESVIDRIDETINENESEFTSKVEYPFLAFLASGGHTSILLCKKLGEYEVLGGTLDDALGEALDKAARLLGLRSSSSGGAAVEASALHGDKESYPMTVPMRNKLNCDFSYAGLKNAFRLAVQTARAKEGLDVNSTNAPASQMEEAPETVVSRDIIF